jgi:hypothetical protein
MVMTRANDNNDDDDDYDDDEEEEEDKINADGNNHGWGADDCDDNYDTKHNCHELNRYYPTLTSENNNSPHLCHMSANLVNERLKGGHAEERLLGQLLNVFGELGFSPFHELACTASGTMRNKL